jgi:hypothetical protein
MHPGSDGPDGNFSGGGHGGGHFPGWSQTFGPPPDDVIAAIRTGNAIDRQESAPAAVIDALRGTGCTSLEALL